MTLARRLLWLALLAWTVPFLLEGQVLLTSKAFWGSALSQDAFTWCAYRGFEKYALSTGQWPLWNPFLVDGLPWQSHLTNLAHPGTVLLWLCSDMTWLFKITLWWSLGLACWGMSCWCLWRGLSPGASALAGLVFAHGGFTVSHLFAGHLDMVVTLAWAPWVALAVEAALLYPGWGFTLVAGAAVGCQWASAHWAVSYLTLFTLLYYTLLRCWVEPFSLSRPGSLPWLRHGGSDGDQRWRLLYWAARWLAVVLLALALSAHQWYPLLEGRGGGNRPIGDPDYYTSFAVPPWALISYLLPHFFDGSNNLGFWTTWAVWEGHDYLGLVGVAATLVAILAHPRRTLPIWGVVLLSWLLGLDGECRFLKFYAQWGPDLMVTGFRDPGRFLFAGHLLLPLAIAQGVDQALQDERARQRLVWALQVVGLALLGCFLLLHYSEPTRPGLWARILVSIGGDSLATIGLSLAELQARLTVAQYWRVLVAILVVLVQLAAWQRGASQRWKAWGVVLVALLFDLLCLTRPWMITAESGRFDIPADFSRCLAGDEVSRVEMGARWKNLGGSRGWFEHGGYSPVASRSLSLLWWAAGFPHSGPLREGGFRAVFACPGPETLRPMQSVEFALVETSARASYVGWKEVLSRHGAVLLQAPGKPARVRFYSKVVRRPQERCLVLLGREPQRWRSEAVLEPGADLPPPQGDAAEVRELKVSVNSVSFLVAKSPGTLAVFDDAWWPGWVATLDGQSVPLLSVNGGLHRGVFLPPGDHRVEMTYDPVSYRLGLKLASGLWVGVLLFFSGSALRMLWTLRSHSRASSSRP